MPFLSSDRLKRQRQPSPAPAEAALCFTEKQNNALRLVRLSRPALDRGLTAGLTLADARARVPELLAVEMDQAADAAFLARIADFCERYTPMTALDAPDGLMLDITGSAHLFGGEAGLRRDLLNFLSLGGVSEPRTAIAGTPQAARALARFGHAHVIIRPGREAAAVAPLPVAALEAGAETATALIRAGLKTVGDLGARPQKPLAARFGGGLLTRLRRLKGQENTSITPRRPAPLCSAERRFAEPIARIDDVLATLEALAGHTAESLEKRGQGGRLFEAALFRSDGMLRRLQVETAKPLCAPGDVLRLFRERIDTLRDPLDPGFGYDLIRLTVPRAEAFGSHQTSLDGRAADDGDAAALIGRLSTRFGRNAVTQFVPADTHIPERAVRAIPAVEAAALPIAWSRPAGAARPRRPVHLFERPQPIEAMAEIPDGPPLKFRWRRVLHEVARAEGPERIAPEWWREGEGGETRDYYCVENARGHRFWVFRAGVDDAAPYLSRWFIHGLFA